MGQPSGISDEFQSPRHITGVKQFRCSVVFRMTTTRAKMPHKNERVELEMKILKARRLARQADDLTRKRLYELVAELEKKLREIDE
jgi:hypothetical protein